METDAYLLGIFNLSGFILHSPISISIAVVAEIVFLAALASVTGAEVAILSATPSFKAKLEKNRTPKGKSLFRALSDPEKLMVTLMVANIFFKIAIVVVAFFLASSLVDDGNYGLWAIIGFLAVSALILFCELLPKMYASLKPDKYWALFANWFLFIRWFFNPVSSFFFTILGWFNQKFMGRSAQMSVEDLNDAIELASDALTDEEDILKGIVKFGNIDVGEILKPRIDVVSVDFKMSLRQVLSVVVESGYSRIPVYTGNFDNVKGILYVKDLLPHIGENVDFRWQALIRPPYFVPETKKVKDLLSEFQSNKIHMAVIVDEYGGTIGIVTLEDILEEIVGEISDESDEDEKSYSKINNNTYIFDGKTLLNDFHKILQTETAIFDDIKGDADTLAGLILELKGAIPVKNEQIKFKQFTFKIEAVDSRRIKQIRVTISN